jgi:hypothetical protein
MTKCWAPSPEMDAGHRRIASPRGSLQPELFERWQIDATFAFGLRFAVIPVKGAIDEYQSSGIERQSDRGF